MPSLRDSIVNETLPGTYVPGFRIPPLRGWTIPIPEGAAITAIFSRIPDYRGRSGERGYSNSIMTFPKPTGLGSENWFLAFSVMVFRKYCGDGSLGRADRFGCLLVDGWAYYSVAGKRFGNELNQTFHRGSWHRK